MKKDKIKTAMDFYLLATKLKYQIRTGWDSNHWNISKDRIESIAEHIYGTCILAISIDSEFKYDIDINKVVKMLVLHELGEVIIGDITPFDNMSLQTKLEKEHAAIKQVTGSLIKKDEIIDLLYEFDDRKTNEAKFAYHCDKLEADIQSKIYQDMGYHNSLDNQRNNVVFKNENAKILVKNGAETAFDIWYEYDKNKFLDDTVFIDILNYIKNNNLNN